MFETSVLVDALLSHDMRARGLNAAVDGVRRTPPVPRRMKVDQYTAWLLSESTEPGLDAHRAAALAATDSLRSQSDITPRTATDALEALPDAFPDANTARLAGLAWGERSREGVVVAETAVSKWLGPRAPYEWTPGDRYVVIDRLEKTQRRHTVGGRQRFT